jgi:mRNA-degrading endonuclease RelE of RelBE toxin-antitoxin system
LKPASLPSKFILAQASFFTYFFNIRQFEFCNSACFNFFTFDSSSIFTKQIKDLVSDEEYRQLQQDLLVQPDRGDLIKNGGGIRKVRCAQGNKGKSGGIRVIYYWVTEDDQIFFLVAYPKSVKDNLTDKETAILRQLVKEQFHG